MYRIQLKTKQAFTSVALIVDGLGRLRLIQFCFQVTEATVATQNLNSLLLYTGSSDAEILQTRESRVLHVCCVKLENESTLKGFLIDYPEKAPWYKAEGGIHTSLQAHQPSGNVRYLAVLPYSLCLGLSRVQKDSLKTTGQPGWKMSKPSFITLANNF